jgi:hypothetical protein
MDSRTEDSGGIREEDSDWEDVTPGDCEEEEFQEIKVVVPGLKPGRPPGATGPQLTPEQIAEMQKRYAAGETISELVRAYGKCRATVQRWCGPVLLNVDKPKQEKRVLSEGIEQTYRENLRWALNAAGEFALTGLRPDTCPNHSAWFLYTQAVDEPKDFMAKVAQMESKVDVSEEEQEMKRGSRKTIEEIHQLLESVGKENG